MAGSFEDFVGDPAGMITGVNNEGFGGVKKMLFGDPNALKEQYDKLIALSQSGGENIKNFLLGQQGKAQQYYAPVQSMFKRMYGDTGIAAPQIPQAPGRTQAMYQGMK